jgi:acyl-CoA thioester hydrolase
MAHRLPVTVWYEDTDLSGMVYHANYLKFVERGRSDWVAGLGIDQRALQAEGRVFAVRRAEADFLAPARLGDRLEVATVPAEGTAARLILDQRVLRDATLLFAARVTLVLLGPSGRPQRLPAAIRASLGA